MLARRSDSGVVTVFAPGEVFGVGCRLRPCRRSVRNKRQEDPAQIETHALSRSSRLRDCWSVVADYGLEPFKVSSAFD